MFSKENLFINGAVVRKKMLRNLIQVAARRRVKASEAFRDFELSLSFCETAIVKFLTA